MGDEPGTGGTPAGGETPPEPDAGKSGGSQQPEDVTGLKSALKAERDAAKAEKKRADEATAELERIRLEGASEHDKALAQARRDAETAERAKWQDRVRATEIRGALRGAGIANEAFLSLAVHADEFKAVAVADDGSVSGVAEAIEAFRKNVPEAFGEKQRRTEVPPVAGGVQTPPKDEPKPGLDRLSRAYADLEAQKTSR